MATVMLSTCSPPCTVGQHCACELTNSVPQTNTPSLARSRTAASCHPSLAPLAPEQLWLHLSSYGCPFVATAPRRLQVPPNLHAKHSLTLPTCGASTTSLNPSPGHSMASPATKSSTGARTNPSSPDRACRACGREEGGEEGLGAEQSLSRHASTTAAGMGASS